MGWKQFVLVGSVSFLLAGCGTTQSFSNTHSSNGTSTKQIKQQFNPAPDFTDPYLNGNGTYQLAKHLGKKFILLNAWASWCPPCKAEAPGLEKMYLAHHNQVDFIGVNMTWTDGDIQAVHAFIKKYGLTFPILQDPKSNFATAYHVLALPTTVLVSPQGNIVAEKSGAVTNAWLTAALKQATSTTPA